PADCLASAQQKNGFGIRRNLNRPRYYRFGDEISCVRPTKKWAVETRTHPIGIGRDGKCLSHEILVSREFKALPFTTADESQRRRFFGGRGPRCRRAPGRDAVLPEQGG